MVTADDVVGVCIRVTRYQFFGTDTSVSGLPEGYCARLSHHTFSIRMQDGTVLAEREIDGVENAWRRIRIGATKARIHASLDDSVNLTAIDTTYPIGNVALTCSYSPCAYDDLRIAEPTAGAPAMILSAEYTNFLSGAPHSTPLVKFTQLSFDYRARSCDSQPRIARKRGDFSGMVGFAFETHKDTDVLALGRLYVTRNSFIHNITLFETPELNATKARKVITVALPTSANDMAAVWVTDDGWIMAALKSPFRLRAHTKYVLVTMETTGFDAFFDKGINLAAPGITPLGSVYVDGAGWHFNQDASAYGPVNLWVSSAPRIVVHLGFLCWIL